MAQKAKKINELGNKLTPAQILYSSNEDLKKIKEEQNAKINTANKIKGISTGGAASVEDNLTVPLPGNGKQQIPILTITKKNKNLI